MAQTAWIKLFQGSSSSWATPMAVLPAVSVPPLSLTVPAQGARPSFRLVEGGDASDTAHLPERGVDSSPNEGDVPSILDIGAETAQTVSSIDDKLGEVSNDVAKVMEDMQKQRKELVENMDGVEHMVIHIL